MKISLHSDLYNEMRYTPMLIDSPQADVIVLAGDICSWQQLPVYLKLVMELNPQAKIICVLGDRESYGMERDQLKCLKQYYLQTERVHILDNDVVRIGNTDFIGTTLWTDFRVTEERRYKVRQYGLNAYNQEVRELEYWAGKHNVSPSQIVARHRQSKAFISEALANSTAKNTVVVTHFVPHPQLTSFGIHPHKIPFFVSDCRDLFKLRPTMWCFGHHRCNHWRGQLVDGVRVETNQCGYQPDMSGYKPNHLVAI